MQNEMLHQTFIDLTSASLAISEFPCASVSKRVFVRYENVFHLQAQFHARFYTRTTTETKAQGKLEMAYCQIPHGERGPGVLPLSSTFFAFSKNEH